MATKVWLFRIVHQDTGKPAQGVPVTVLDKASNAEGHWVSDADGVVAIPRRDTPTLRLRVGLRSEDPIELTTTTLGEEPTPLAAPSQLPPTVGPAGERPPRELPRAATPPPGGAEQPEVPGHVLYFQRLVAFAPAAGAPVADVLGAASDGPGAMSYGALIEVEEYWQSLGVLWGELLYSVTLTPGDEAKLAVLDDRWRREADGRERPLQILARMVGTSMLGDLITTIRPELQLDPRTLAEPFQVPLRDKWFKQSRFLGKYASKPRISFSARGPEAASRVNSIRRLVRLSFQISGDRRNRKLEGRYEGNRDR